jgi:hypothetical protein
MPVISYVTNLLVYRVAVSAAVSSESRTMVEGTLALEFRKNRAKGLVFQKLVVVTSRNEGFDVENLSSGPWPFSMWVDRYRVLAKARAPSALLFALGDNAVFIGDDGSDVLQEHVISGKDPRLMTVEGAKVQIVHVCFIPVSKERYAFEKKRFYVSVFVEVDRAPTRRLAEAALEELKRRIPDSRIQVVLRTDPWFIGFREYPAGLRFVPFIEPITEPEYLRAPEVHCTQMVDGGSVCAGRSLR